MPTATQIPIGCKLTATRTKQPSTNELYALYDRIYDIADRLIKKHNPCEIRITNKKLCCVGFPTGSSRARLCCEGCWQMNIDHYSLFGCSTECLPCKTYLCESVYKKNKLLSRRLSKLRDFTIKHFPLLRCYQSKEQWLKQMKDSNYGK